MFNVALATVEDPNQQKNWFNFNIGTLWRYGKFNIVTTLYLGAFIIYVTLVGVIAIFGKDQTLINPDDIRIGFKIFLFTLPFMIAYLLIIEHITAKNKIPGLKRQAPKKSKAQTKKMSI